MPSETCSSYGWFGGCIDDQPTTSPTETKTHKPAPTDDEPCSRYGWFGGCKDPMPTESPKPAPGSGGKKRCKERLLFWWCKEWEVEEVPEWVSGEGVEL